MEWFRYVYASCDPLSVSDHSLLWLLLMILFFNLFQITMNSLFLKALISESFDQPTLVLTNLEVL